MQATGKPRFFRTRGHVLVCVGPRCVSRGSQAVFDQAWADYEREGLAYYTRDGGVRLTSAGCLGACGYGPNVTCYRTRPDDDPRGGLEEAWYSGMTRDRILALGRAVQRGSPLPTAGRYDDPA